MRFKVTTPPAEEPITLDQAKAHLSELSDDRDPLILDLIKEAREYVEEHTRRALVTQTITLKLDRWTREIALPRPPFIAIQSVGYVDSNGVNQTMSSSAYHLSDFGEPAVLRAAYGSCWPTLRSQPDSATIVYTAGYGSAADVPQRAKSAMLLLIGQRYENREAINVGNIVNEIPNGLSALLSLLSWGSYT